MDLKTLIGLLVVLSSLSVSAKTTMKIVSNFSKSTDGSIWEDVKKYHVPNELIKKVTIADPDMAFRAPYNNIFFQNKSIVVCNGSCDGKQNIIPKYNNGEFTIPLGNGSKRKIDKINQNKVRQSNVYYWVNALIERITSLGYSTDKRLIVQVDREVADLTNAEKMENNAFFNPADNTLSFLPARSSLLIGKLNPSAFDPSVAIHETGHFVFSQITKDNTLLNGEVASGLNEGFADYMAMSILDSAAIGSVMARGKALRVANELLTYESGMESHDLGNVFVAALWNIRKLFCNKDLADKIVFESIIDISKNAYAQAQDYYKSYMNVLSRLAGDEIKSNSELVNKIIGIFSTSNLLSADYPINIEAIDLDTDLPVYLSASITMKATAKIYKEMRIPLLSNVDIAMIAVLPGAAKNYKWFLISIEDVNSKTPLWIYLDVERDSVLEAYDLSGNKVSSENTLLMKKLEAINDSAGSLIGFMQNYAKNFRDISLNKDLKNKLIWKSKKAEITNTFVNINGKPVAAKEYNVKVRRTAINLLASSIFKSIAGPLKSIKRIKIYTVEQKKLGNEQLPLYIDNEVFVGYEVIYKTGLSEKIMVKTVKK